MSAVWVTLAAFTVVAVYFVERALDPRGSRRTAAAIAVVVTIFGAVVLWGLLSAAAPPHTGEKP